MYEWYKAAAVYLFDVLISTINGEVEQQIRSSNWFTRGWTLQELLAPHTIIFFDQQWEILGTKQTLSKILTLKSGIDEGILNGEPLSRRPIAHRMSWAPREKPHAEKTRLIVCWEYSMSICQCSMAKDKQKPSSASKKR